MSLFSKIFNRNKKQKKLNKSHWELPILIKLANIITSEDILHNKELVRRKFFWGNTKPQSILCFLPFAPDSIKAGGFSTILNICNSLSSIWQAKIYLCFYPAIDINSKLVNTFKINLKEYIPNFEYEIIEYSDNIEIETDIALCTFWLTAYPLLKYNRCKEKYYIVQDFENTFYPSGSEYTLAELTYKFGFNKLVNSNALKRKMSFIDNTTPIYRYTPGINHNLYFPDMCKNYNKDKLQIVVYGRPSVSRNTFDILVPVFKTLKAKYNEKIQIISVGENYELKNFGLEGIIENKGKLNSLEDLAKLYRESDIGISFITTPTFSYQHLEFMASGLCLVTNKQEGIEDFLKDGENAVVCEPLPNIITNKISQLIDSPQLRQKISLNAYEHVKGLNWDECFKGIANFITSDKKHQGVKNAI